LIEFFLSKIWATVFGVALITVLLLSFQTMDSGTERDLSENACQEMVNLLEGIADLGTGSTYMIDMDDILAQEGRMEITGSTVRSFLSDQEVAFALEVPLVLLMNGHTHELFRLELTGDSVLHLEVAKEELMLHLEKSSTIFLTEPRNF
jgi:hypothetical protein